MILGQVKTEAKSNEITAIPTLLDMLELEGAIVTIDAMGCQRTIAKKIVDYGADYVLSVKENQAHLLDDIKEAFAQTLTAISHTTTEKGGGVINRLIEAFKKLIINNLYSSITRFMTPPKRPW